MRWALAVSFLAGTCWLPAAPLRAQDGAPPAAGAQDPAPPADVRVLKNGDRLTGAVVAFKDDELTFRSPLLGELKLKLADVQDLQTTAPVTILTQDGERYRRRVIGVSDGQLRLGPDTGPAPELLPFAQLQAINPPEGAEWRGALAIGAFLTDGNTDRRGVHASFDFERRTFEDRLTGSAAWQYAQEKATGGDFALTERRLAGRLKYDYFVSKRVYLFADTLAESDAKQDLDLRYTAGVGLGYQWIDRDDLKFSTETGISYFYEDYETAADADDYAAARGAWRFEWLITEGLRFLHAADAFLGLESTDDLYVKSDARLKATLTDNMFAQLQWIIDWDNTPGPGNAPLDQRYLLSVGWSF